MQFEGGGLVVEEGGVGAEQDAGVGDECGQFGEASDGLLHGDVEVGVSGGGELGEGFAVNGALAVEQDEGEVRVVREDIGKRGGVDGGDLDEGVLGAFVFHHDRELDDQLVLGGKGEEFVELGSVEGVAVVVRVQTDAAHVVDLAAAADVFLPVGQRRIDAAEGEQQAVAVCIAFIDESAVNAFDVLVQQGIEATGEGMGHAGLFEPLDQPVRLIVRQTAEGPSRQADVHVDHALIPFSRKMGSSIRRRF